MKLNYKMYSLLVFITLVACESEEDNFQNGLRISNMAQMYDSNGDVSRAAYKHANEDGSLTELLSSDQLTGLLPSEQAFKSAGFINKESVEDADSELLKQFFLYHIFEGAMKKEDFSNGAMATLNSGKDVSISVSGDVTVTGLGNQGLAARLVGTDALVTNGYVHTIDRLLLPASRHIVDVVEESGVFDLFEAAVIRADLKTSFSGTGPFTVFAPTDPAFISWLNIPLKDVDGNTKSRATLETEAKALINSMDENELADLLKYHVVSGSLSSHALVAGNATTLQGSTIKIEKDDKGNLKSVTGLVNKEDDGDILPSLPLQTDVLITNGYIQVIDRVLLPE